MILVDYYFYNMKNHRITLFYILLFHAFGGRREFDGRSFLQVESG
jgi:hypothetical protein